MVVEFTRESLLEKSIDTSEKGCERFAGTGRRGNENVAPRLNGRPSLNLDIGGLTNLLAKPFGNERMKLREGHGNEMLPRRLSVPLLGMKRTKAVAYCWRIFRTCRLASRTEVLC